MPTHGKPLPQTLGKLLRGKGCATGVYKYTPRGVPFRQTLLRGFAGRAVPHNGFRSSFLMIFNRQKPAFTMKKPTRPYYPPAPFAIIQDTREQTPLHFPSAVPVIITDLYPGDYSINGLTNRFAVERKSLDDLIGSLIGHKQLQDGKRRNNRDRLIEELSAMRSFQFKAVVVTSPRSALEGHYYNSRIDPANVIGMIAAIEAFTGVQFKFFANPDECARWLAIEALHFWRYANGLSSLRPKLQPERLLRKVCPMPKPPKAPKGTPNPCAPHARTRTHAHACDPKTTNER